MILGARRNRVAPDNGRQDESNSGEGVVRVSLPALIALHRGAEHIALRATRIRAPRTGGYLSPFKGRGMEFDETRPYQPGDDVRSLDWRVTARTGKPHTKLYRDERERPVLIWVDFRRPMFFATRGAFKAVVAARAGAVLAWSAAFRGDRLGGQVFSESGHQLLRPRRGKPAALHLLQLLANDPAWSRHALTDGQAARAAGRDALARLRRVAHPGSLVYLISDFRHLDPTAEAHIAQLARHTDMVLVNVYDPLERELPPAGDYRVSDGTETFTVNTADRDGRAAYEARFNAHRQHLLAFNRSHPLRVVDLATTDEPARVLRESLGKA